MARKKDWRFGFNKTIIKKIKKTWEARSGGGIYKRRNKRTYRILMHLSTYDKIISNDIKILDLYKDGYVVRVRPNEYFDEEGEKRDTFPDSLKLGQNAFIHFEKNEDWEKLEKYCSTFIEVAELKSDPDPEDVDSSWIGKYVLELKNRKPQLISIICQSGEKKEQIKARKDWYEKLTSLGYPMPEYKEFPKQRGLGNFDYDYASTEEMEKISYQLSYLIHKVPGMKERLITELSLEEQKTGKKSSAMEDIDAAIKHITEFCEKHDLIDFDKLSSIDVWDKTRNCPICPLCKEPLTADEFFEIAAQDKGREEVHNTKTTIELMHVNPLRPGEFNHSTYNLGWGHGLCNTMQGNDSITGTLDRIKKILKNNNNYKVEKDKI